jgi:hypothetical protein
MPRRKSSGAEPFTEPVEAGVPEAEAVAPVDREAEREPEPAPEMPAPTPAEPAPEAGAEPQTAPPRRSGVLGPLFGGVLAAGVGFGLAHFDLLRLRPADQGAELAALEARLGEAMARLPDPAALDRLESDLAALESRIAALEAVPAPVAPDLSALTELERRLSAIEALPAEGGASTAALTARLADLERRLSALPQGVDQAEVDAALARLAEAEAEAARRAEAAAAEAAAAARDRALAALRAAVASGAGFEAELAALGDPALSERLAPHAAGVAALSALQAEFPGPAREALALARAASGEAGWGARLVDFLAAQTGARSLTPREGDDADAILSRAEFALGEGRLADALAELRGLDAALQAPLADWIARAEARLAVDQALEGL